MGDESDALDLLDLAEAGLDGLDAVGIVRKVHRAIAARLPTAKMQRAERAYDTAFHSTLHARTEQRLGALEAESADGNEFRQSVLTMARDVQFLRLHLNLQWEAARSTLTDRQEMLGCAAAELSLPGLPIEDKALIERTLRSLDTRDVHLLRDFATEGRRLSPSLDSGKRGWSSLVSTGCLNLTGGGFGLGVQAEVSWLGSQVLQVLKTYAPEAQS